MLNLVHKTRPLHAPHHKLPTLFAFPSPTKVENTRFYAFKKKRVSDGLIDKRTDHRTDVPS